MKKQKRSLLAEASTKSSEPLRLEETLPLLELILESQQEIEAVSLNLGLKIMSRYMEAEIAQRQGRWGQQTPCGQNTHLPHFPAAVPPWF